MGEARMPMPGTFSATAGSKGGRAALPPSVVFLGVWKASSSILGIMIGPIVVGGGELLAESRF